MNLFQSPPKPNRPNTSITNSPDSYICTPIDLIYYRETSEISPNRRIPQISKPNLRSYSSNKNPHRKACSVEIAKYGHLTNYELLNTKEFLIKDILTGLKAKKRFEKFNTKKFGFRTSSRDIEFKRNLRCTAINHLLNACEKIESSKELNKVIEVEKGIVHNWVKAVDKVEKDLKKIDESNADIVQHLYYFNKFSNDEICKEISRIKMKTVLGNNKTGHQTFPRKGTSLHKV